MTEGLNPNTLDLVGVLSGRDYPTLDIEVYFNEALGFAIYELRKMQQSVSVLGSEEEAAEIASKIQQLVKDAAGQKYTITLKGVPEKVRNSLISKISKEFPEKSDLMGRPQPNPEADTAYTRGLWQAYLNRIVGPTGASKVIDEADVDMLIGEAPATVHEQINEAIHELRTGAKAGFEFAAKEVDFLSQASPEG